MRLSFYTNMYTGTTFFSKILGSEFASLNCGLTAVSYFIGLTTSLQICLWSQLLISLETPVSFEIRIATNWLFDACLAYCIGRNLSCLILLISQYSPMLYEETSAFMSTLSFNRLCGHFLCHHFFGMINPDSKFMIGVMGYLTKSLLDWYLFRFIPVIDPDGNSVVRKITLCS